MSPVPRVCGGGLPSDTPRLTAMRYPLSSEEEQMGNGQDTRKWQASGRWRWLTSAVLAVFVLLSGLASPSGAQMEEGGLRLTPDVSPEGRDMVEIYHDNEWRGVCDGSEDKLIDCGHSGWGQPNDCGPDEYAGVRCGDKAKMVDLSARHLTVDEADTTSIDYTVKLSGAPDDDVTVTVAVEGDNVLVNKTTLTFTAMNYSTVQTITVTTQDDGNAVDDTVLITHTPSGGGYDATSVASVRVTVLDNDTTVPGRIAGLGVWTPHSAMLLIRWGRPADTGGAAITGYEVRYIKAADDETVDDNWTVQNYTEAVWQTTFTGLLSGTTYEVQVRAMNRKGYGAWSASGTGTIRPAPPGAPTVTAESVTRLHVEWAAQAAHEVAVTAYDVQYRQAGRSAWERWPHAGTARQTTITGLQTGTVYRVQVRARNAGGPSPWSGTGTGRTAANTPPPPGNTGGGSGGGGGGSGSSGGGSSGGGSSEEEEAVEVPVGYLENPSPDSFQSGIGVISGWVCAADEVVIEIAGTPHVAAYGTGRLDTQSECGDTDNGFGLLFNWNLLGDGEHEVIATVDGMELGRATVRVTTLGEEFVRGAAGECTVSDFPHPGETAALTWQESSQNFVITEIE